MTGSFDVPLAEAGRCGTLNPRLRDLSPCRRTAWSAMTCRRPSKHPVIPGAPSGEDLQQPLRHDCGRVGILPGDQVAVLHHVWIPDRAATELDADLFLQLVLK